MTISISGNGWVGKAPKLYMQKEVCFMALTLTWRLVLSQRAAEERGVVECLPA